MYEKSGEGVPRRIQLLPGERAGATPPVDHLHPQCLPGMRSDDDSAHALSPLVRGEDEG